MKKLMILSAAAMAISFVMPQFAEASTTQNNITVSQEKEIKYTEIAPKTLPAPVTDAVAKDYTGYVIDMAFQGDDGSFKVAVSKESVKTVLRFTSKGELIK